MALNPRFVAPAGALIMAALVGLSPMLGKNEGRSLKAYRDPVGVWTICEGITHGVKPGDVLTEKQCDELVGKTTVEFMTQVANSLKVPVSVEQLIAHTHFAYNVGINGYKGSQVLKLTNAGKWQEGCKAMMNWYRAGGRDCRIRANGCPGLIVRRNEEIATCLTGAEYDLANAN